MSSEYNVELSSYGWVVTKDGSVISSCDTEDEAYEFIEELENKENTNYVINSKNNQQKLYKMFDKYCEKLPGKVYLDSDYKFATVYSDILNRFIKSFEKSTNAKVIIKEVYKSGETYTVVDEITIL